MEHGHPIIKNVMIIMVIRIVLVLLDYAKSRPGIILHDTAVSVLASESQGAE